MTRACVIEPKGNSQRSGAAGGMAWGIFPSMGHTVLGDLKLSRGGSGGALAAGASASLMSRPMPPRLERSSAFACGRGLLVLVLASGMEQLIS